jgi:hypothetical protein
VLFPPLGVGDNFLLWGKGSLKFSPLIGGGETGCKRCNLLGGYGKKKNRKRWVGIKRL